MLCTISGGHYPGGTYTVLYQELKDHPALMFWAVGNELDHVPGKPSYHPQLWDRLNELAVAIKQIDTHHPVLTVVGTGHYERKVQEIAAACKDMDLLGVAWDIRPEVQIPAGSYAGSMEKKSQPIAGLIRDPACRQIEFTAPQTAGGYRLFVTAVDGQGHVAYGNIPFLVVK